MGKWPKLDEMKLSDKTVDDHTYDKQLKKLQDRLLEIQLHYLRTGGRAIIGVDGWDAAGKGGLIQRFVFGLEPRSTHVCRIGAPTVEEQGRHYLWRFWTRLPAPGNWTVFDRTWYGRVLVERIEGLLRARLPGSAPTAKSTSSSANSATTACASSRSSCMSAPRSRRSG